MARPDGPSSREEALSSGRRSGCLWSGGARRGALGEEEHGLEVRGGSFLRAPARCRRVWRGGISAADLGLGLERRPGDAAEAGARDAPPAVAGVEVEGCALGSWWLRDRIWALDPGSRGGESCG